MDIKSEFEYPNELLEREDGKNDSQSFEQHSGLQKIQENKPSSTIDAKNEIKVKSEVLDVKQEKDTDNCQLFEQIFVVDESQTLDYNNMSHEEEDLRIEVQTFSCGGPQTSSNDQMIEESVLDKLTCTNCKISFKSEVELEIHLKLPSNKLFKCVHCCFDCNMKNELRRHKSSLHSNLKLFKCTECCYESNRKESLKRHMLTHTNIKLFKCTECDFECNRNENLKRHMLFHSNIKLFKCSECGYECNLKRNLMEHMLKHGTIKLYKCTKCSYACNYRKNLKSHLLTHENYKLLKCTMCSYECNHKSNLELHMLKHENIKLFKCTDCNYECNRKGDLKKHRLTHESVKLFQCPECNYGCNRKYALRNHMLRHTKQTNPPTVSTPPENC